MSTLSTDDLQASALLEAVVDLEGMLFQNWSGIVRTVLVGSLAYATLVLFLRISGKRTLAKLNAFDLVVTVALGSTLSAIILQESIALAEGAMALALLILLQFLVTFWSVRSASFASAIRSEPSLLVRSGQFCRDAMKRAHHPGRSAERRASGWRQ